MKNAILKLKEQQPASTNVSYPLIKNEENKGWNVYKLIKGKDRIDSQLIADGFYADCQGRMLAWNSYNQEWDENFTYKSPANNYKTGEKGILFKRKKEKFYTEKVLVETILL